MTLVDRLVAAVLVLLLVAFRPFPTEALDQKFPPLQVPQLKFERYKLANGMEVILSEDHRLPIVSVNLWYHVGAVNETARRTGFAHLFEHMMFEGSRHVPGNSHFRFLEAAGASDINGTTEFDRTNYYETILRASSSWHSGWSPIAWGSCPTTSIRPISRTSRMWCATKDGRTTRTRLMAWFAKPFFTSFFRKSTRTTQW